MHSSPIRTGLAAIARADWLTARQAFETALNEQDTPEAHDGLGLALWWLNDISAAHHHRTQAFLAYQRDGNLPRAAWLAAWLAREQVFYRANMSAMNGWFARAERLLQAAGPCVERAWLDLYRASVTAPPHALRDIAQEVVDFAHSSHEPCLEALALAFAGLGAASSGDLAQGLLWIDEAMTMASSGEILDHFVVCEIFCVTLSACELAGDWVRTDHWCAIAQAYASQHRSPFLSAYCRTTYGGVLLVTGRWNDAERVLQEAIETFDAGHQALRVHAVCKLADLRVGQGRLEEAEVLLAGYEDYGSATLPRARLHLARGEPHLARAVLVQSLQSLPKRSLYRAPLQRLMVDCCLALDDSNGAQQAYDELVSQARSAQSTVLQAEADLALGQIRRARHDPAASICFVQALQRLSDLEQSVLAGRAKLELARELLATDPPAAITWARAALASFTRLGASHDADAVRQFLRAVGVATPLAQDAQPQAMLTAREREVLTLIARGLTNRGIGERLVISEKTAEHHVRQILSKLGLRSRTEAAAYAVRHGLAE
jgi:ATP/maltotriose-dependent transcriptional regulator MalT